MHYREFKSTFNKLATRCRWDAQDMMLHLRAKLKDTALQTIATLGTSEQDVRLAWHMLDSLFDDPKRLTEASFESLTFDDIIRTDNPADFMRLSFAISSAKQKLQELNATVDSAIVYMAMKNLPASVATKLPDFLGNPRILPTCKQLTEFLARQHAIFSRYQMDKPRSRVLTSKPDTDAPLERRQGSRSSKTGKQGASRVYAVATQPTPSSAIMPVENQVAAAVGPPKPDICFICNAENHNLFACPVFVNCKDKIRLLIMFHLCIYCGTHRYVKNAECRKRSTLRCETCGGDHVTALHRPPRQTAKVFYTASGVVDEFLTLQEYYKDQGETQTSVHLCSAGGTIEALFCELAHPQPCMICETPYQVEDELPATSSTFLAKEEREYPSRVLLPTAIAQIRGGGRESCFQFDAYWTKGANRVSSARSWCKHSS